jgi:hypothetical protein
MQTAAIAAITLGGGLSQLLNIVTLAKDLFVLLGDQIGKFAAQAVALATLDFTALRAISNDAEGVNNAISDTTDFFESFVSTIDSASSRISEVLIPSFREARSEIEDIGDGSEKINKTTDSVTELTDETEKLAESFTGAADAAKAISESFDEEIAALELQLFLLSATNEELGKNAEARALAAGATDAQAEKIGQLTETLANEQEALRRESATLEGFFEEVGASAQRTLSGFLANPLSDGLDELPGKFAQVLQQLAADALSSELFSILNSRPTRFRASCSLSWAAWQRAALVVVARAHSWAWSGPSSAAEWHPAGRQWAGVRSWSANAVRRYLHRPDLDRSRRTSTSTRRPSPRPS